VSPCSLPTCRDCGELLADKATGNGLCPDCAEESEYQKMWDSTEDDEADDNE